MATGDKDIAVDSYPIRAPVGTKQTPINGNVRTIVSKNSNNQYNPNQSIITFNYSPVPGKSVVAASSPDGGKTWTRSKYTAAEAAAIGKPEQAGQYILQDDAFNSLNKGALKTAVLTASVSSLKSKGLTQQQIQSTTGIGKNQATSDPNQANANSGSSTGTAKVEPYVGYKATDVGKNEIAGKFATRLQYPLNMHSTQDKIKFLAVEMEKTPMVAPGTGGDLDLFKAPINSYVPVDKPIYIGIQNGISDQNTVSWGEGSMTARDAFLFNTARKAMSAEDPSNTAQEAIGDLYKAGTKYSSQVLDILAGEGASMQNTLARTQGMIMNPNLELLFQAPQLRPFNFQFKMSARDSDESQMIKGIIKYFKRHMAVRKEGSIFLKAPHVFTIQYMNGDTTPHPSINLISKDDKTKACALTSMNVDYTPNGSYMTYDDGTMVAYTISLQFMELEPVYDTDYETDHPIGY